MGSSIFLSIEKKPFAASQAQQPVCLSRTLSSPDNCRERVKYTPYFQGFGRSWAERAGSEVMALSRENSYNIGKYMETEKGCQNDGKRSR